MGLYLNQISIYLLYYLVYELKWKAQEARIRKRYQSQSSLGLRLQHLGYASNNPGKDFSEYNK